MNKCDFCTESRLKDGILICPYNRCMMAKNYCLEIAQALAPKITLDQSNNTEEQ